VTDETAEPSLPRWVTDDEPMSARRIELRRLADAGRDVIERMASVDIPHDVLERAAAALEGVAELLEGPGKTRRYAGFAESANAGGDPHAHFDHSPVMGMANPIAPPVQIEQIDDATIEMRVSFGSAYEGPPGCVHGGVLAATFDEVLGMTQSLSGQPGMTGTLSIKYRRPTPLHDELRFVGTLDRVEGRKIITTGRCFHGDELTAEADGLFVRVDFARLAALMQSRDQPTA